MNPPTVIAPGLAVTMQPNESDIVRLAALGYRTIINNRPDGEEAGQMPAASARAEAERLGLAYVHIPVMIDTIGTADVTAFDTAIRQSPNPVVAHCRTGTRSYLLWAAGQALDGKADPAALAAEAASKSYDLKSLPDLVMRLRRPTAPE